MSKSAKTIVQDVMLDTVSKSLKAMLQNNVDNAFVREAKSIHDNTTFADLPPYIQRAIMDSVDQTFLKLHAAGFKLTSTN